MIDTPDFAASRGGRYPILLAADSDAAARLLLACEPQG